MAARSIASFSLSFGLVAIPVRLYSATESSAAIRFKLMASGGRRIRQQYVAEPTAPSQAKRADPEPQSAPERSAARSTATASKVLDFPKPRPAAATMQNQPPLDADTVVERFDMVKGYEYAKDKFVLFTNDELKALQAESRKSIDIVSFIPEKAVDPLYYDKAYLLAPDKRGSKPYGLLLRAMRETERCALAKWAFRSKEYVVQIRAAKGGLVLQQLLYADEVRSFTELQIEVGPVGADELSLAKQLIAHISADGYDPTQYVDEEKKRILAAVERKITGKEVRLPLPPASSERGVIDLVSALRASLQSSAAEQTAKSLPVSRKPAKRATRKATPRFRREAT